MYARKQVVEMLGYMEGRQDMPISKLLGKVMSGISKVRRESKCWHLEIDSHGQVNAYKRRLKHKTIMKTIGMLDHL